MKLPDLFVNAVTTFDGKALTKGQKQIGGLEKSVKSLAKAFGVTLGVGAVAAFGKASVKAFADDQAAAVRLTKAVENLGLGFEDTKITRFIADLEKSAAVADDVLRPAFQSLLSTTGSVTKSQDLLALSLEISAGSGVDAAEVAKDLSLAYLGQTKGLSKYNTGLSKTELTAAGFLTIQEKLTEQYSGQNAARLDTYAGKVSAVQIAYGNLQETVGGALIDAFMKLAGDTTTEDLTDSVDNLADSLAAVVELTGQVAAPFVGLAKLFNDASGAYVKLLYKATGTAFMGNVADRQYGGAAAERYKAIEETANAKARAKAEAEAAKRQKELLALQKKSALAEKNKLSLSQAAAFFDTQRISIAAALKATYDKETRLRLEALMAIEDDNGALALAKIEELAALQNSRDMDRLKGITVIKDAVLASLNEQLLTELRGINATELAEAEKERLRDIAFGKYNSAIMAAGDIAEKTYYSERVQIQLTEIAKLASLSNTVNAMRTGELLRMDVSLNVISKIREAQALADKERMDALLDYINLLKTLGGAGVGLAGASSDSIAALIGGSEAELDALTVEKAAIDSLNKVDTLMKDLYKVYNNSGTSGLAALGAVQSLKEDSYASSLMPFAGDSKLSAMARGAGTTYNVTVNAGAIGSEQLITQAVQEAVLAINRAGDSLVVAGAL